MSSHIRYWVSKGSMHARLACRACEKTTICARISALLFCLYLATQGHPGIPSSSYLIPQSTLSPPYSLNITHSQSIITISLYIQCLNGSFLASQICRSIPMIETSSKFGIISSQAPDIINNCINWVSGDYFPKLNDEK